MQHYLVKVRKGNGCWFVVHPITGVYFVEHTAKSMRDRVLWLYGY